MSGEQVAEGFLRLREAQLELLDRCYADFLSPHGDVAGVVHSLEKLPSGRGSAAGAAQAFLASDKIHDWAVR
jgi:hypothetical protein